MILIDTSAWIDFFRDQKPMADKVAALIEANRAALAGPILTELLRGIRTSKQRAELQHLLQGCHWISDPENL